MKRISRTIVPSLLLFIGVSGVAHGQSDGAPSSSNAAAASEETPAQVRAEESKDPRLKAMSASDQKAYLDEVASSIQYCTNNDVLNNFYSCSCFSKAVFDARMDPNAHMVKVAGGWRPTPLVNLVPKLDISACVAPAKIPAYAANRTKAVVNVNPDVSPAQLVQLTDCVSSQLTTSFVAKPYPNIDAINGYFNSAYNPCYEKIVTGNAPATSPANHAPATTQNPGSGPAPGARAPAARVPIPTTKSGILGRLHNVINHANLGALEQPTAVHPVTTTAASPQVNVGAQPPATTATNQELIANNALYMAVIRDDAAGCANAIAQGAQVNSLEKGITMLINAARQGLPVTQCLVDHGADVNLQVTERGNPITPVWAAVEFEHFDVMDYLVEKGAPVNATSGNLSLLMYAIGHGTLKDVEFLVEHGANVNFVWQGGSRPESILAISTESHHSDETAYLQAHGAHQ